MTQEEKLRAYNEAIRKAKIALDCCDSASTETKNTIYNIFPELEDESIKEEIIDYLKQKYSDPNAIKYDYDKWIAWLEKQGESYTKRDVDDAWLKGMCDAKRELEKQGEQKPIIEMKSPEESLGISSKEYNEIVNECLYGEQKPADRVEPKFHKGDWIITNKKHIWYVDETPKTTSYLYRLINQYGKVEVAEFEVVDEKARLWTIQDAKDGDVLYSPCLSLLWIFKSKDTVYCGCNLNYNDGAFCGEGYFERPTDAIPATKEQRDTLFAKMKEADYEWNAEKKELKKIEAEEYNGEDYGIDSLWHAKNILEKTLGKVDGYQTDDGILEHKCAIAAVNKLYKQKPSWSKEDEKIFGRICALIHSAAYKNYDIDEDGNECGEYANIKEWFKKLKDRVQLQNITITDEELVQAKKDAYNDALDKIEYHSGEPTFDDGWSAAIWYLKKRNAQPQNTWKPSDEQMKALHDLNLTGNISYAGQGQVLIELHNDLIKL